MPRLTAKGQVTLPVDVRFALGLKPGDEVVVAARAGHAELRPAAGMAALFGVLRLQPRPGAHPLELLLTGSDDGFVATLEAAEAAGRRLRMPDALLLDLAHRAYALDDHDHVARTLRDVLAVRTLRFDHARALRAAVDALAHGDDPFVSYASARA